MTGREHGTRAMYVTEKCRCDECTEANRLYYHQTKRRVTPKTVGAARARRHLRELAQQGIGYKAAADAAGISRSAIYAVIYGGRDQIKPDTERAILGVTPANIADGAYVDAGPTWEIIDRLLGMGWTKAAISGAIGGTGRALQLNRDRVRASSARAVQKLWDEHGSGPVPEAARPAPEPPKFWEGDTSWMKRGACRSDDVPTWLFFAGRGDVRTVAAAKAVCAMCGVADECLQYALRNHADGVWGGLSAGERRGMKPAVIDCADCGTAFPFVRKDVIRCDDCYPAHRRQQRYRWQREVGRFRQEAS